MKADNGNRRRGSRDRGSLTELPNGTFKARMSYIDAQGRRHQPAAYFATKRAACNWLHEQHVKHARGQWADARQQTVGLVTKRLPETDKGLWLLATSPCFLFLTRLKAEGLEPSTYGLKVRCSTD
jgi:hypothetical protein